MIKLDESSLRREGWRGDHPVVMDDGQTWYLPRPRIRYRKFGDALRSEVAAQGEYQEALEAVDRQIGDEEDEGAGHRYVLDMFRLAHAVIRLNYDLSDDQVATLVSWSPDEADGPLYRVIEVAQGRAPKPTGDGDAGA